jgi:hypothetical protein
MKPVSKDLRIMHKIQNPKKIIVEAYDEASIYIMDEEFYKICLIPKCKYLVENEICDLYGKKDKPVNRNCYNQDKE